MEPPPEGEHGGFGAATTSGRTRKPPRWWQTLPGVITALAALITAVTGLLAVFHSGGSSSPSEGTVVHDRPDSSAASTRPAGTASRSAAATESITLPLPSPAEVKLSDGDATIRVLSMRLEPYNAQARTLAIALRYTNNRAYDSNFWDRSFRLLVDDVPQEPTGGLNELVGSHAAKEGTVVFQVSTDVTTAVLRILIGNDQTDIPLRLSPR